MVVSVTPARARLSLILLVIVNFRLLRVLWWLR